ncbi:MAG: prephenate dehydrogenase/arogenate dehydrogenase family protein [Chloroflexota bacterium]|nr:prephenate dehydrogenase/arogenate dehydrogenase family protein [Chloroflexota bacterium]
MGGSVALALSQQGHRVRGVTRSEDTLHTALQMGAVEGGSLDLSAEVAQAGLVLVAAPTQTSIRLLGSIASLAPPDLILTDACSSKGEVVRAMNALPPGARAVGGHPMAGKEVAGIQGADPALFHGATWVLSKTNSSEGRPSEVCELLARLCGSEVLWVDAEEHDRAVATISHLPLLTAAALVLAAEESGSELAWRLAASGFRDTTRLAAGEPEMGADLALTNSDAVRAAHGLFAEQLGGLVDAARAQDKPRLLALLAQAAARRQAMYRREQ